MFYTILAIMAGASAGAILRWSLGLWLDHSTAWFSAGTLAANWIGAYLIGLAFPLADSLSGLSPHVRPLLITGFLGSLTTFSGFSLEVAAMLQSQRWGAAAATVSLHLFGSLLLTLLGIMTVSLFRQA